MPLTGPQRSLFPRKESMVKDENAPLYETFPENLLKEKLSVLR
jgi:hypothetical protein